MLTIATMEMLSLSYEDIPVMRCMHVDLTGQRNEVAAIRKLEDWVKSSSEKSSLFKIRKLHSQERSGQIYVCFPEDNGDVNFGRIAKASYDPREDEHTVQDVFGNVRTIENRRTSMIEVLFESLYVCIHAMFICISLGE